jgi:hypothetical protein
MKPTLKGITLRRRYILALFSTAVLLCLLLLVWNSFQISPRPRLRVLPANAVTRSHHTQFIALTNGAPMEKGKRFVGWRIAKIRGYRFPALSGEISVGGLANLYRSVDTLSAGIMIPLEFGLLKARFPPNCPLTNAPTSLRTFRPALEEALCYNGIVGIREGRLLRLVKSEWLRTNSNSVENPEAGLSVERGTAPNAAPPHR